MSAIVGVAACKTRLLALLAEGQAAQHARDGDRAGAVADALVAFTNDSRPDDPDDGAGRAAIAELNAVAARTADELTAFAIAGAVGAVVDRSAEIAAIGATLGRQADAGAAQATRLRLAPVESLINQLAATVTAARKAATALDSAAPDEAAVAHDIAEVVARLQALIVAAGKIGST